MTEITAEQAWRDVEDELRNRIGGQWLESRVAVISAALSAPRAPDGWRSLIERLLASDGGDGRYNASEFLAARDELKALLAAAPAPADATLIDEGNMGQVPDSDEIAKLRELQSATADLCRRMPTGDGSRYFYARYEVAKVRSILDSLREGGGQ